jgi:hypothetical protein
MPQEKSSRGFFDFVPWSMLRGVGNSYAAKVTILIPLFAYLIVFNDKIVGYLHLVAELGGNATAADVSPRLLLVYFGLVAIAVGTILYGWLCPAGVKFYGSSNFYVSNVQGAVKDFKIEEYEKELKSSRFAGRYKRMRDRYESDFKAISDHQKSQIDNGVLHLYYDLQNLKYPLARILIGFLYLIGFACLLYPSAGVFWRVSKILYRVVNEQSSILF